MIKFVKQLRRDCKLIDDAQQAITIIGLQAKHQWRYMNDELYRMEYFDFLEDMGLSMSKLMEDKLLVIPIEGDGCVICGNQGSSETKS